MHESTRRKSVKKDTPMWYSGRPKEYKTMSRPLMMILVAALALGAATSQADWANNTRYAEANQQEKIPGKVIFFGDSITDAWINRSQPFFVTNNFLDRGISGQTTAQMLCRFRQDVIDLKPRTVVILAGINDIAENIGPISQDSMLNNIKSMTELAKLHGIKVCLCSVTPCNGFPWNRKITDVVERIQSFNVKLKAYAENEHLPYVDYYSKLVDDKGGMGDKAADGVHPNPAGYAIMEALVLPVVLSLD